MGAYSRWALIRGWAPIRINTVVTVNLCHPQNGPLAHSHDVKREVCINRLIFGEAAFFILFFLNMPTNQIVSQI